MAGRKTFSIFLIAFFMLITGCNDAILTQYVIETETVYINPDVHVQVWQQPPFVSGTDIIWAIDGSCSMGDDTEKIVAGIETMMAALPQDEDWRLVMMSTDKNETRQNELYPLNPFSTIDDVWDMYDSLVSYGLEAGFDAVMTYVDEGDYAHTWMRNDAALLVIIVSDEDDQSVDVDPIGFASWLSHQSAHTALSAIVRIDLDPCGDAQLAQRYLVAVDEAEGQAVSFCGDWSLALEDMAGTTALTEEFKLDYLPIESTITVRVDNEPTIKWTYDPIANSITFADEPGYDEFIAIAYGINPSP